jgi:hypothetical protein
VKRLTLCGLLLLASPALATDQAFNIQVIIDVTHILSGMMTTPAGVAAVHEILKSGSLTKAIEQVR